MIFLISELDCMLTSVHSLNVSHRLCILFKYEMIEIKYPKVRFIKVYSNRTGMWLNIGKAFYSDWLFATTPCSFIMTVFSDSDRGSLAGPVSSGVLDLLIRAPTYLFL